MHTFDAFHTITPQLVVQGAEQAILFYQQVFGAQEHLRNLHEFYGEPMGVRIARKHVGWYLATQPAGVSFQRTFNALETAMDQQRALDLFFARSTTEEELAA